MEQDFITRTPNGLFAEATVRDVSFIFHIEGKGDSLDVTKLPDYIFYDSVISKFLDDSYEIKIEGSKTQLKSVVDTLSALPERDSHIVFMDRDHDEFLNNSVIRNDFVYYTFGYSFENDFWTSAIMRQVFVSLFAGNPIVDVFIKDWKELEKKIAFIHKFNLLSKVNCRQVFSFRGLCGILFQYKEGKFIVDEECLDRYKSIWNGFNIRCTAKTKAVNKILNDGFYSHPGYLIQGHAYESYVLEAIHQLNSSCQIFEQNSKNFSVYKNIAFSHFRESPLNFMSPSLLSYYSSVFIEIKKV
jgi:hypothetical protein